MSRKEIDFVHHALYNSMKLNNVANINTEDSAKH